MKGGVDGTLSENKVISTLVGHHSIKVGGFLHCGHDPWILFTAAGAVHVALDVHMDIFVPYIVENQLFSDLCNILLMLLPSCMYTDLYYQVSNRSAAG